MRMAVLITEFAPRAPDRDNGRINRRRMTSLASAPGMLGRSPRPDSGMSLEQPGLRRHRRHAGRYWDISPAWIRQLDGHRALVVPLRMNGVTRSVAFSVNDSPLITWSGATIQNASPFDDLYLWLGRQAPGFGKTTTGPDSRLPGDPERPGTRYPVVILHAGSLACLVTRRLPDGDHEFGAHAYGPHADPPGQ